MDTLIFDYDGTIHDCFQIYAPAVQAAYDDLVSKGQASPYEIPMSSIKQWIGITPEEMWNQLMPCLPQEQKEYAIHFVMHQMIALVNQGKAVWYPGANQVLCELKRAEYKLILLSNCPLEYLKAHRKVFHLEKYFDEIYCAEEFGYASKHIIVSRIQKRENNYIVIGDRKNDIEIALRNHMVSIGCSYGYGGEEELQKASYVIDNVQQILQYV